MPSYYTPGVPDLKLGKIPPGKIPKPGTTAPLGESYRGPGLRVRFSRIKGETARGLLMEPLYLPVVIGDFVDEETFDHRDYDTIGAGQFSAPRSSDPDARTLRDQDLDTLVIDWHRYARWLVNPQITPEQCRKTLRKIGLSKTPVEMLAAVQLGANRDEVRMNVTLRTLSRTLKPGEADTRYMSLALKEWRPNAVGRRGVGAGKDKLPTTKAITAKTTLRTAAEEFYGSDVPIAEGWVIIAQANGLARWGGNTPIAQAKGWKVGKALKVPKPSVVVGEARNLGLGGGR